MTVRLEVLDMGQQMCVLLTCAWVLWQTTYGGGRVDHSVVQADDTKAACEEQARVMARAAAVHSGGTLVAKYAVQLPGRSWLFHCPPDTVRP
jgi:hypothetical protein